MPTKEYLANFTTHDLSVNTTEDPAPLTEPETAGVERRLVPGHRVLVDGDVAEVADQLHARAVQLLRPQVQQDQVVIWPTGRSQCMIRWLSGGRAGHSAGSGGYLADRQVTVQVRTRESHHATENGK